MGRRLPAQDGLEGGVQVRSRGASGLIALCLLTLGACATFNPQSHDSIGFRERAVTQSDGGLTISAAALGPEETQRAFGVPAIRRGIQPVWLRIENNDQQTFIFAPIDLDPMYFTPAEAAYINHAWFSGETNAAMDALFQEHAIGLTIPPGEVSEGFVYVAPHLGSKFLNITLIGDEEFRSFRFVVDVPGLTLPPWDPESLYGPGDITDYALADLRPALEALPCCVKNASGEIEADPLNVVIIGEEEDAWAALIASGWADSEQLTSETALQSAGSFLFGTEYQYSPFSPLYAFGRPQDAGFQKARSDVDERNHMRIWLTPLRADGRPVWVGAISRDIGVITSGFGTTHKIDPDVDAERWYLAQNLAQAQALESFGYVGGGPVSTPDATRTSVEPKNIFYSDGLRIVLVVSSTLVPGDSIQVLDWVPIEDVDLDGKFDNSSGPAQASR